MEPVQGLRVLRGLLHADGGEQAVTPQQRAIQRLEREGYLVDVVERISRARGRVWRNDLFGAFDLLACHPARRETVAIQVTSRGNVSHRVKKLADLPALDVLRTVGWRLLVWGYGPTKTLGNWKEVDIS
jgi:hypothetical protein